VARFPDPPTPDGLRARLGAQTAEYSAGHILHRLYKRGGRYPAAWGAFRHYGPVDCRFDHHPDPKGTHDEGILYCAPDPVTCIAEAFQDTQIINRSFEEPYLAAFATVSAVILLDLTGRWSTRAGASMAICTGSRSIARKWSRTIYLAYPEVQGLLYCSAMNANAPSVALYERARAALPGTPERDVPLSSGAVEALLGDAVTKLQYGLV
jgi:hypothetical protein